jgi:hypothetical protein
MATLISKATGNLTTSGTFAVVATGTGASQLSATTANSIGSATTTSSTFTITSGQIVDGILLHLARGSATAGTLQVKIRKAAADVQTVTINLADLPVSRSWVLFKLPATVTGAGTADYDITLVSAGVTGSWNYYYLTTTANMAHALRTTTAQVPTTLDDLYIVGELTGAGTGNDFNVTMDQIASFYTGITTTGTWTTGALTITGIPSTTGMAVGQVVVGGNSNGSFNAGTKIATVDTATQITLSANPAVAGTAAPFTTATAYGNVNIGKRGSLTFGVAASTNYMLRLHGDLNVWADGTYNQGTVGTPIPRTSTAVLEFATPTDGGFGLNGFDGGFIYAQGLSRTSGKNIVSCKSTGGKFTANTTAASPTLSNVSDFTNVAVGQIVRNITSSEVAQTTNLAAGLTISSFDSTAKTITLSGNAAATATAGLYMSGAGQAATSFTVDTDTGWLSGDLIAIATTSKTQSDCEIGKLTANASATSLSANGFVAAAAGQTFPLSGTGGLLATHLGYPNVQAEVILLTRNVQVRSISPFLMTYANLQPLATVDMDWVQFYYLGENATGKRGIEITGGAAANPKNFQYCSLHDCEDGGLTLIGGIFSINTTIGYLMMWNLATTLGNAAQISNPVSANDYVIDNTILIRSLSTSSGWNISDIGGVFTNATVAGAGGGGFSFGESLTFFGTFSNLTAHGNNGMGFAFVTGEAGVFTNMVSWRNTNYGAQINGTSDLTFAGGLAFGNSNGNLMSPGSVDILVKNYTLAGDATFGTPVGYSLGSAGLAGRAIFENCSFGVTTGSILTSHSTGDVQVGGGMTPFKVVLRNCLLASPTEIANQGNFSTEGGAYSQKHDQTAGNHMSWRRDGKSQTDTVLYKTAAPSERLTPSSVGNWFLNTTLGSNVTVFGLSSPIWPSVGDIVVNANFAAGTTVTAVNASGLTLSNTSSATTTNATVAIYKKMKSGIKQCLVNSGATLQVSAWIRQSVAGDGAAYAGQAPRLMLKANPLLGITTDTVIATAAGAAGTWEQLTGTTPAATDDGVYEFYVDCDGPTGWVNVDDWGVA